MLRSFARSDGLQPSIFEINFIESLNNTFKPALDKFAKEVVIYLTNNYILTNVNENENEFRPLRWVIKALNGFTDEIYLAVMFMIEYHCISKYEGSFAESFFGLKRARIINENGSQGSSPASAAGSSSNNGSNSPPMERVLTDYDKAISLSSLLLFPYFYDKLVKLHKKLLAQTQQQENRNRNNPNNGLGRGPSASEEIILFLKTTFVKVFPILVASYNVSNFAFQLMFMFGKSSYSSVLLYLQSMVLTRITKDDMNRFQVNEDAAKLVRTPLGKLANKMLEWARLLVTWYYSPDNARVREARQQASAFYAPAPVPPKILYPETLPRNPNDCPLCSKKRVNPAASPSGFVFCYSCIHKYVSDHGRCPLSGIPCKVLDIRPLFET